MIGARTTGRNGDDPDGPALEDAPAPQERVVVVPLRTMLAAIGLVLGAVLAVELVGRARAGLTLIAVAAFLALALNPSVVALQRRGLRRGEAVAAVCALAAVGVTCIALVLVPPLVEQGGRFVDALPRIVAQLTDGHGPLGFLETRYHVVERLREATSSSGGLAREATSAVSVLRSVAATVLGVVVIAFLTLFMLIEGPEWRRRAIALTPQRQRPAVERIGAGLYRSVAGFVTGTLLASLAAAVVTTAVMLVAGIPYALPLAVFVAIVEVVPFIGPVLATLVVTAVAITESPATAAVVFGLLLAYHAIEGHTLRPFLYGRAVRLSPLTVLISILLCTEIAGILGAVVAIPVAGTVDVLARELLSRQTSSEGAHA